MHRRSVTRHRVSRSCNTRSKLISIASVPATPPSRFTLRQRHGLFVVGVVALIVSVVLLVCPLDKTTTAKVTGAAPSVTVTKEDGRSDTFATALFALGAVFTAAGLGIKLGFGGASVEAAAALANQSAALRTYELAQVSGNAEATALTEETLKAANAAVNTYFR